MVVFDTSVLVDLFNPSIHGERRERLDDLVKSLEQAGETVMVPTPAYAEFLVKADTAKSGYHQHIEASKVFRVEPFSQRAAIECADLLGKAFSTKEKRNITKTKFKFDWMIVAQAKAHGATRIYFFDGDIGRCAATAGLQAVDVATIPLPKGVTAPLPFDGKSASTPPP